MKPSTLQLSSEVSLMRDRLKVAREQEAERLRRVYRQAYEAGYTKGVYEGAGWAVKKIVTAAEGLSYEP